MVWGSMKLHVLVLSLPVVVGRSVWCEEDRSVETLAGERRKSVGQPWRA